MSFGSSWSVNADLLQSTHYGRTTNSTVSTETYSTCRRLEGEDIFAAHAYTLPSEVACYPYATRSEDMSCAQEGCIEYIMIRPWIPLSMFLIDLYLTLVLFSKIATFQPRGQEHELPGTKWVSSSGDGLPPSVI